MWENFWNKEAVTAYKASFFSAFGVVLYAVMPVNICCVMGTMPEWETISLSPDAFVIWNVFDVQN